MRLVRRLAAAAFAALLAVALFPSTAGAVETVGTCIVEEIEALGGPEATELIILAGQADGAPSEAKDALTSAEDSFESCVDAPNPILPEINEIIWGSLAFFVLLGLMWWKLFPAVGKVMNDRQQRIRDELDAAERAKDEAAATQAQFQADLADARSEAGRILEDARSEAEDYRGRRRSEIDTEIAELRERANSDVESAREQALADLRTEVSDIALGAAEAVVGRTLQDRDTQVGLIEDYINQVGAGNGPGNGQ